ncbi:unnamed protein product [Adineta steineri]|uniref:Lactate/malate dehydrogenase N-terminal domain-containing protein n=1 Tax=Adineta steineri TaxID=433720 RepID=A0A814E606_9BILA|nr:unnamed protein product [Adineta steineri]CAF0965508.1 unnamed protein product [Adineta steineri]CAF3497254.1 unnamed protein product [Adineta steineri]CAF3930641.1 unnamed protein product [Adineta steineri]
MKHRSKLHPSSCFPPNPSIPNTQNRLFFRNASLQTTHYHCPRLTFIGINATTYSSIAALLSYKLSTSIECIKLFDIYQKLEVRPILNDLQLLALFNRSNTHLEWVQSYWETKDSTIIIINVQHNQLETETISTWIQMNASLVENVVSQVCIYSPHATLIICTQPNELMTYVASRVSKFPNERIIGLGASVDTTYAHRTILDQTENIHGRVNGFFILGNESMDNSCSTILTHHLTIDGILCSDIYSKSIINKSIQNQSETPKQKLKEWNLITMLKNKETIYSNVQRRLPLCTNLIERQKIAMKYLLPASTIQSEQQESIRIPMNRKLHSNYTEAMLIVHITRALLNGCEFQSNFTVNISLLNNNSKDIFINYPTIIGSSNRAIEYMFPFHQAENILKQRSFLIPYEKLQRKIHISQSTD